MSVFCKYFVLFNRAKDFLPKGQIMKDIIISFFSFLLFVFVILLLFVLVIKDDIVYLEKNRFFIDL